jgi:hypothetical protein
MANIKVACSARNPSTAAVRLRLLGIVNFCAKAIKKY